MAIQRIAVLGGGAWGTALALTCARAGRDVMLSPKQEGPALNYFVYPYVEVDGKPYDKLDKQFGFEEVKSST